MTLSQAESTIDSSDPTTWIQQVTNYANSQLWGQADQLLNQNIAYVDGACGSYNPANTNLPDVIKQLAAAGLWAGAAIALAPESISIIADALSHRTASNLDALFIAAAKVIGPVWNASQALGGGDNARMACDIVVRSVGDPIGLLNSQMGLPIVAGEHGR